MRFVLAAILGFSFAVILAAAPFLLWDSNYRYAWDPDRPGSAAMGRLSSMIAAAAFAAAIAVPLAAVSTRGLRKPFPVKWLVWGFCLGSAVGVGLGCLAVYAVHYGWR
jgi:hypothetical protein